MVTARGTRCACSTFRKLSGMSQTMQTPDLVKFCHFTNNEQQICNEDGYFRNIIC